MLDHEPVVSSNRARARHRYVRLRLRMLPGTDQTDWPLAPGVTFADLATTFCPSQTSNSCEKEGSPYVPVALAMLSCGIRFEIRTFPEGANGLGAEALRSVPSGFAVGPTSGGVGVSVFPAPSTQATAPRATTQATPHTTSFLNAIEATPACILRWTSAECRRTPSIIP
jgi:hypothetical protein